MFVERRLRKLDPDAPPPADPFAERVSAERDRLYGQLLLRAIPGAVAFVALAGFLVFPHVTWSSLAIAGVVLAGALMRHAFLARAMARSGAATHLRRDAIEAAIMSVIIAAVAGGAVAWWFGDLPVPARLAITIVFIGAYAVSIAAHYAHPTALFAIGLCLLGPLAFAWMGPVERSGILVGIALILLVVVAWYVSVFASSASDDAIRARLREVELSQRLEAHGRELQLAIKAKTQFLAAASHDLRQPVTSMNLLLAGFESDTAAPGANELATQIRPSVDAMAMILGSMLEMARLEAGMVTPRRRPVDLRALLLAIQIEYTPRASALGIELRTDAPALTIQTDPDLLIRVVRNLVDNAHKFTTRGYVEISARQDGAQCVLGVRDTGIGIPRELHDRVFDDYFQAGNAHRSRTQGLGLGLAIVRRLIALLGGSVALAPVEGAGTRIEVRIPTEGVTTTVASAPPTELSLAEALAGKARMLVVDDDPLIRAAFGQLLAPITVVTRFAASAQEASAVSTQAGFAPDVAAIDYRLPGGISGLELTDALIGANPTIAVVMISGDLDPLLVGRAAAAGAALLTKPFAVGQLAEAIAAAREQAAVRTAARAGTTPTSRAAQALPPDA